MIRGHIGIRRLERITRDLREVIKTLEMDTCNFNDLQDKVIRLKKEGVTNFIRQKTRLWRETWCLSPLKEIEKKLKRFL